MGKRAKIVAIALGMLVGLGVAAVLFLESAWMRGWLEDQASEQLGRRVEIADHGIRWGLPLTLELDEVRIANPDWAETPDLARIDQLAITLDVGRLLRGEIELERVALQRPELLVLRRDDGSTNLDDLMDGEPTQEQEALLWPEVFVIEQGALSFRDEGQAIALEVAFETPGESTGALSLRLQGEGEVQQDDVQFQAGAQFDIEERRGAVEDFVGQLGDSRLEGALAFDLGAESPQLAVRLHGDTLDLDRLGLMPGPDEEDAAQPDDPEAGEWDRGLAQVLAELEAIEAELDLALERLHYGGQSLHDLEAQAAVSQGRLTIERLQAYQATDEEGARSLWAQGWLESQDGRLAADLSARFERIDLTAALAPFGLGEIGTLDGELNLQRVEEGLVFDDTRLDYEAPQWELSLSLRADSVEREGEPRVHLVGDGRYAGEPLPSTCTSGRCSTLPTMRLPIRWPGS
ncbi:AsmA family protein [Halomonas sp. E19]|uniref:AsmA family protein n=1 Tax=Halomonas sp. E19 TaxID=3397247 RepID=UPI004033DFE8